MNVAKVLSDADKNLQSLTSLRNTMIFDMMLGEYRNYKSSKKAYAAFAVKNKNLIEQLPPNKINVPLFSKTGFNMLKIWFIDKFRIKTSEEKQFKKLYREIALRKKYA